MTASARTYADLDNESNAISLRQLLGLIELLPPVLKHLDDEETCSGCAGTGYEEPAAEEHAKLLRATIDALVRAAAQAREDQANAAVDATKEHERGGITQ